MGGPHRDAASGAREIRSALAESRRSFLAVGLFSAFVNLLMLTGPVFMLQVYDRVLSSRSEATLVALIGIVAFLFLAMGLLDHFRGRVLARAGACRPRGDAALCLGPRSVRLLRRALDAGLPRRAVPVPLAGECKKSGAFRVA